MEEKQAAAANGAPKIKDGIIRHGITLNISQHTEVSKEEKIVRESQTLAGRSAVSASTAASIDGIDGIRVCLRRHSFIYDVLVFIRWMHYFYYYSSLACTNKQHIRICDLTFGANVAPKQSTTKKKKRNKSENSNIEQYDPNEFNGFSMRYLLDLFMFDDAWNFIEATVRLNDYIFQWILNNRTSTWLQPPPACMDGPTLITTTHRNPKNFEFHRRLPTPVAQYNFSWHRHNVRSSKQPTNSKKERKGKSKWWGEWKYVNENLSVRLIFRINKKRTFVD